MRVYSPAADDVDEDPQEVLAAFRRLAKEIGEMAAELTRVRTKATSVATGVMPLVDMTDRSMLGFAAGLDLLHGDVVPELQRLVGGLVADAERLADPRRRATDRAVVATTEPAEVPAATRLRQRSRTARRRARWAVFDRSYHQGFAGALELIGARLTIVAEGLIEARGILDQRLSAVELELQPDTPAAEATHE